MTQQSNTQQGNKSAAGAQPREASVFALTDLLPDLIADNDEAIDALKTGRARGPCTGIASLDKALGGFFETGLHLLQASPGAGKTALALQIASDCQFPALYVTAEMPPLELLRRLIARQTKTFLGKLKGQLSSKNLEDLARLTISRLPHIVIVDATSGLAGMDLIRKNAEGMRATFNSKTVLVVFDSLHVWARSLLRGIGGEYEIISEGTRCATELTALLNAPILAIAHRNRESNKRQNGGGLHGAKGSGDLEYESWSVLDLWRDMDKREDSAGEVEVEARFYKNRSNGLLSATRLKFHGALQSFRDDE